MMAVSPIKLTIGLLLLVVCQAALQIDRLPEYEWETRQDWPECCQYSSVVRAFLCSACNPALTDIPSDIPADCWVVDLSFNQIQFIGVNALNYLQELQYLVMNSNRLGLVEPGALSDLTSLNNLDLANNLLTAIPEIPPTVATLHLEGNPIEYVNGSSLSHLVVLTELGLSVIELGSDTFSDLNLNSLEIQACHIHRNAFRALAPDYPLNLINPCPDFLGPDGIVTLEPFAFANMGGDSEDNNVEVTIQNATIAEIPYRAFYTMGANVNSVRLLDIDGLTSIQPEAFSDSSALESITIQGEDGDNVLTLYAGIITGFLPTLTRVDFSDLGVVESIHAGIFDGLDGLTDLYLDGLELTYITPAVLLPLESQLVNLNVGNNPYRCDCNLRWLKELFDRASFNWYPETTICASPPAMAGMRFDELIATDFVC